MKKCVDAETMSAYVDRALPPEEMLRVRSHMLDCPVCGGLHDEIVSDNEFFAEWMSRPVLPDDFAEQVMEAVGKEEVEKPSPVGRSGTFRWKWIGWSAAALVFLFGALLWVSPTFAEYLGIDFSMIGLHSTKIDKNKNDYQHDLSITDKGVTFRIIELVANPTEIIATYEILKDGKRIDPEQYQDKEKRISFAQPFLVDGNGKMLNVSEQGGKRGANYGYFAFRELPPSLPEKLYLEVRSNAFNGIPGNWNLRVPIRMEKAYAVKKTINQAWTSPDNLFSLKLKEITYTNTRTLLTAEFGVTQSVREKLEKQVLGQPQVLHGEVFFTVTDDKGNIVAQNLPGKPLIPERMTGSHFFTALVEDGMKGKEQQIELLPAKGRPLFFKLHAVLHDFESEQPYRWKRGETTTVQAGPIVYTFKKAELGDCLTNVYVVGDIPHDKKCFMLKGTFRITDKTALFPFTARLWKVTDESGKSYMADFRPDHETARNGHEDWIKEEHGFVLVVHGMDHAAKAVELRPWVPVLKEYEWKVPIPAEK